MMSEIEYTNVLNKGDFVRFSFLAPALNAARSIFVSSYDPSIHPSIPLSAL
jgi:hypothetical protein